MNENQIITVDETGVAALTVEVAAKIAAYERAIKSLEDEEKQLKSAILDAMEKYNVIKLDSKAVTITYVPQTDRESFDSKAFKADFPDLYDGYVRMTPIKASLRVKVKSDG